MIDMMRRPSDQQLLHQQSVHADACSKCIKHAQAAVTMLVPMALDHCTNVLQLLCIPPFINTCVAAVFDDAI